MPDTNYGFIRVEVKTAGGALPVERAVVTIKDTGGEILAVFFTDASGQTPTLKVLAPSPEYSEAPGSTSAPFFNYNIDTDKEGYVSVRNIDAPVYPGITSIQPVELNPVAEGSSGYPNDTVSYNESFPPNL